MKFTPAKLHDPKLARVLLQLGLAAVLAYAAFSSLTKPDDWTAYLPSFLVGPLSPLTLVRIFAIYEIVLVVWLFSGKYLQLAGLLCALTFGGIVVMNLSQLIVTFRDVGLMFMALALAAAA
jgi:hypothetical protein